ncbi:MAG: TonB-dependent receptor [Pseudomonadota bacterium]
MRIFFMALLALVMVAGAAPAFAQEDSGGDEIIVTGFRSLDPDDDDDRAREKPVPVPAAIQMLRRTADFAVQQVMITGDTREEDGRREEIQSMARNAIGLAAKFGVQLSIGDFVIEPLTLANVKDLPFSDDEDGVQAERIVFLVKVPLAPGIDSKTALARIAGFIKGVPAVGRAEMKPLSELTLSVVNPEQYRGAIIDLVARDTAATSGRFGPAYGVEVSGLDRPVQWRRAGLTEVQLFLPSAATVRPRD